MPELPQEMRPEYIEVDKNTIVHSLRMAEIALDYAQTSLAEHDATFGRTTRKNLALARMMETDIAHAQKSIKTLRTVLGYTDVADPPQQLASGIPEVAP